MVDFLMLMGKNSDSLFFYYNRFSYLWLRLHNIFASEVLLFSASTHSFILWISLLLSFSEITILILFSFSDRSVKRSFFLNFFIFNILSIDSTFFQILMNVFQPFPRVSFFLSIDNSGPILLRCPWKSIRAVEMFSYFLLVQNGMLIYLLSSVWSQNFP